MPHLSAEQIAEIEHEMADLVDENNKLREENRALRMQLQNMLVDHRYPDLRCTDIQ